MTFLQQVDAFRKALINREETAVDRINELWLPVYRNLISEFNLLFNQVDAATQNGLRVSEAQLYRTTRLAYSIQQLSEQISLFNQSASVLIKTGIETEVNYGFSDAANLVKAALGSLPEESTGFAKEFLSFNDGALVALSSRLADPQRLADILEISLSEAKQAALVYIKSIARGDHPRIAARELTAKFDIPVIRARTTARTEIISAYRESNIERYKQSKAVKGWMWSATLDDRTCPVCVFLDGQIFELDEPFATHPNCRCAPLPVTFSFEELGIPFSASKVDTGLHGEKWFKAQPASVQETILHPKKYQLWKEGKFTLGDLVNEYDHKNYGPSRDERSIKDLRRLGILR